MYDKVDRCCGKINRKNLKFFTEEMK